MWSNVSIRFCAQNIMADTLGWISQCKPFLPPLPSLSIVGDKMAPLLSHSSAGRHGVALSQQLPANQIQWPLSRLPAVTTTRRTRGRKASSSLLLFSCFWFRCEAWSGGNLLVTKRQAQSPLYPSKLESRKTEKLGSMMTLERHTRNPHQKPDRPRLLFTWNK